MGSITLTAPMAGWASALDAVPDPVFAGRLLGDGMAIDPVGAELCAPCDGTILTLHAARHAVTMASDDGVELLMHIGVDTVELGGAGFEPLVAAGQKVRRGEPLVRFDLDGIACQARSLLTPLIITNGAQFAITRRVGDGVVAPGDALLWLEPVEQADRVAAAVSTVRASQTLVVPMVHGIHARPAARIGEVARCFTAHSQIVKGGVAASTLSPIGLLGLAVVLGDEIVIEANGDDAQAAVAALAALIAGGMGEAAGGSQARLAPGAPTAPPVVNAQTADGAWIGTLAAPGFAVGRAAFLRMAEPDVPCDGAGIEAEQASLAAALAQLSQQLEAQSRDAHAAAIAQAHRALLADPALVGAAEALIAEGRSAAHGWRESCRSQADVLRKTGDTRLAERADDLIDLGRQLVAILLGREDALPAFAPDTVLIAPELLPSQIMQMDDNVIGIVLEQGGPTSHVAILAAGRGIPMLVALGDRLGSVVEGRMVVLDADSQLFHPDPSADAVAAAQAQVAAQTVARAEALAMAQQPCISADGARIEVFANLGALEDAAPAIAAGAEGCGLLRTEFLFLDRDTAPTVDEQQAIYSAIAAAMQGRPLIVRLMDIGGDKPAPYLPMGSEANPALGLRGIRVGLSRPDMLDAQLRAILAVQPAGQCRMMLPMVASAAEIQAVRHRVEALRQDMGLITPIEIGIMIETPAAAVTAATLARHADFFSVGSNDLTQYALAMDRDNPAVAGGIDGLHPGALGLIALAARGAQAGGRWIGVCGGLAADRLAVPLLLGLGITELSMPVRQIPEIKALVRRLSIAHCRDLAERALALEAAQDVRALSRRFLEELSS